MRDGRKVDVRVIAGALEDAKAPSPPPNSWASRADSDVAIWCLRFDAGARWTLPAAVGANTVRTLFFFAGSSVTIGGEKVTQKSALVTRCDQEVEIIAGDAETEILLLQGRPIGKPVVQHGPFVMNTRAEIQKAISDYQRTRFGGWPWPSDDPVHGDGRERFAQRPGDKIEM
jgi:hypothetical protein